MGNWAWIAAFALLFTVGGCEGVIGEASGAGPGSPGAEAPGTGSGSDSDSGTVASGEAALSESGLRRLTRWEMGNALADLFGEDPDVAGQLLPADLQTPGAAFDNEWALQEPSSALIFGVDQLAWQVAERVVADPARRDDLLGCVPSGVEDVACFASFVDRVGRLALRRPLETEDREALLGLHALAVEAGDFDSGVRAVLAALLQHPRFLYRVELGSEVEGQPGVFALDEWEIASRLSFLIWGSAPDEWLLDAAAAGELGADADLSGVAEHMLTDPRAARAIKRYHAQWLDYEDIDVDRALAEAMFAETDALVMRTVFEERAPWIDLFLSEESFVDDTLAEHYGMTPPGSAEPVWTSYAGTERRGILSHGAFLAPRAADDDTSPTHRGLAVRARLLCLELSPPAGVVTTLPEETAAGDCKPDILAEHTAGGCQSCHSLIDPIGFGLEQYDNEGRFRTHEEGKPHCLTDGVGELNSPDMGTFVGPRGLAELLVETSEFRACMQKQFYRHAVGRWDLTAEDLAVLGQLDDAPGPEVTFHDVVFAIVTHDSFVHRREQGE